jgi:sugar/nucleoside kinase (ribokinase family)
LTVWIVGPVAWDTVVYTDEFLTQGGSTQGKKFIERPGGTGANVARALSTTGINTGFVGYLGTDNFAKDLEQELRASQIAKLNVKTLDGPTSHVLILVDGSGDRTILGLARSSRPGQSEGCAACSRRHGGICHLARALHC